MAEHLVQHEVRSVTQRKKFHSVVGLVYDPMVDSQAQGNRRWKHLGNTKCKPLFGPACYSLPPPPNTRYKIPLLLSPLHFILLNMDIFRYGLQSRCKSVVSLVRFPRLKRCAYPVRFLILFLCPGNGYSVTGLQ